MSTILSLIVHKPRKEFEWVVSLQQKQKAMLKNKTDMLYELYELCETEQQRDLLKDLIVRFDCFDEDVYNLALLSMVEYISSLGYNWDETAIVAFCHNSSADSSQRLLNDIKVPLYKACNCNVVTINRFDRIERFYRRLAIKHFIAIDEFIGSGQTILNLHNDFTKKSLAGATIDYCLIAGMEDAIINARANGLNVKVEYSMKKGISAYYSGESLKDRIQDMTFLEDKLASQVGDLLLSDYHLGYRQSEALYSKLYANVPNNVFPIFWWKRYKKGTSRMTIFDRVQDGY